MPKIKPREATIAITYRCNLKCSMCNIWKQPAGFELPAEEYRKLPSSISLVNITGGEHINFANVNMIATGHDVFRNINLLKLKDDTVIVDCFNLLGNIRTKWPVIFLGKPGKTNGSTPSRRKKPRNSS